MRCGSYLKYTVIEQDLYSDHVEVKTDYLSSDDPAEICLTISNPAYCIKFKVLLKAFQSGKPFMFLLPVSCLHTVQGAQLFSKYPVAVFCFARSIKFIRPDGSTTAFAGMAWFVGNAGSVNDYIEFHYLDANATVLEDDCFSIVGQDTDEF